MKKLFFTASLMGFLFISCSDNTCKDPLALNLGIEDNCQYSRVAFYITSGQYINWTTLAVSDVLKSEIFINGKSAGTITKIGVPNNCSTPGVVNHTLTSGNSIDWSNTVSLSNGNTVTFSGTVEASPSSPCITVKAD
jgi:hypothetical protein